MACTKTPSGPRGVFVQATDPTPRGIHLRGRCRPHSIPTKNINVKPDITPVDVVALLCFLFLLLVFFLFCFVSCCSFSKQKQKRKLQTKRIKTRKQKKDTKNKQKNTMQKHHNIKIWFCNVFAGRLLVVLLIGLLLLLFFFPFVFFSDNMYCR